MKDGLNRLNGLNRLRVCTFQRYAEQDPDGWVNVLLMLTIGVSRYQNDRQNDEGEIMGYHRRSCSSVAVLLAFCVLFTGCFGPGKGGPGGERGPGKPGSAFLSTVYDTRSFNPDADRLPPMYTGHNPEILYSSIEMRKQRALREPQETEDAHKARMALKISLPLMGSLDFDSMYAVRVTPAEVRRDEKDGLIHMSCRLSAVFEAGLKDTSKKAFVVRHLPQLDNRYTITRQDGTRVTIEETKFSEYAVVAVNARALPIQRTAAPHVRGDDGRRPPEPDRELEDKRIEVVVRMTAGETGRIEGGIMALLVGRLAAPYTSHEEISRKTTAERPGVYLARYHYLYMDLIAIWFYDVTSGRIIRKMRLS